MPPGVLRAAAPVMGPPIAQPMLMRARSRGPRVAFGGTQRSAAERLAVLRRHASTASDPGLQDHHMGDADEFHTGGGGDGGDDGASGGEGTKRAPSKEEKALGEVRSTREFCQEAQQKICWLGAGRIHGLQPLHH